MNGKSVSFEKQSVNFYCFYDFLFKLKARVSLTETWHMVCPEHSLALHNRLRLIICLNEYLHRNNYVP